MYITLSNIQNGAYSPLNPCIDNRSGAFEISLAGMTYYHKFQNISAELGNNKFTYGANTYTITDGYYNICDLNEYFKPLKSLTVHVNPTSGLVVFKEVKKQLSLYKLGEMLGFAGTAGTPLVADFAGTAGNPDKEFSHSLSITAKELPTLALYKELFIHLDSGLDTSENIHNGFPSTLLHTIALGEERCNAGAKGEVALVKRQWKRLSNVTLAGLKISVRDIAGKLLPFAYLSVVLEIRKRKG